MYKSYSELGVAPEQNVDLYSVVELAHAEHKQQVLAQNLLTLVNIHAEWCGPCKQTAPNYSLLASQFHTPGRVAIVKYNYDKLDPQEKANIHGIPVYQFYIQGRKIDEVVGADLNQVEEKLKNYMQQLGNGEGPAGPGPVGPQSNRSMIRNHRPANMPSSEGGVPYQGAHGREPAYHQPYQGPQGYRQGQYKQ